MPVQLPLGLSLPRSATFEGYVAGDNVLLLNVIQQMTQARGERQVYVWGESGSGKTHLLQAACHAAAQRRLSAAYLPLKQFAAHGVAVMQGLERLHLICIDDIEAVATDPEWQQALFVLINEARASHSRLLMTAACNVPMLSIALQDLCSRLSWGPVFHLKSLSDADKIDVLKRRAAARGLKMPDEVGRFMLRRYPRELRYLCERLDDLDQASMATQRRLTVPFVKAVMDRDNL